MNGPNPVSTSAMKKFSQSRARWLRSDGFGWWSWPLPSKTSCHGPTLQLADGIKTARHADWLSLPVPFVKHSPHGLSWKGPPQRQRKSGWQHRSVSLDLCRPEEFSHVPFRSMIARRSVMKGLGASLAAGFASVPARAMPGVQGLPVLSGTRFNLTIGRQAIDKTGRPSWANAINGGVPGPVLHWRQGDVVTLNVTNRMPEMTGLHWHGIILPNTMDGVPGLEFPGIQPGETFTYRFPVLQSGTYWYHSHMGYQEQKDAYGALVIDPAGDPLIQADRDYVVVLSDWMDGDPAIVQNNLKHDSDYYNYHRRTLGTFADDVAASGLRQTVNERLAWGRMRMDPTGLAEPTGALYTYLMNGVAPEGNWTALFRPGERVRLRFINASAVTFYDVRIPGLAMDVVHVHGNDVEPVRVDEFRIGVAETYDVIVQPAAEQAYPIVAQSLGAQRDGHGHARPQGGHAGRAAADGCTPNADLRRHGHGQDGAGRARHVQPRPDARGRHGDDGRLHRHEAHGSKPGDAARRAAAQERHAGRHAGCGGAADGPRHAHQPAQPAR